MSKVKTKIVTLTREHDGDVTLYDASGEARTAFHDATDLTALGLYLPAKGRSHKVRITCEVIE